MSLSSLLSIARTALLTHQRAVDVTGHNIANASTKGYTRQRLNLVAATPLHHPQGFIGRGVEIAGIERPRNAFLDSTFRQENGALAQFGTLRDALGEIEATLGEPSAFGLAASLDAFWSSWGDLANTPLSGALRAVVRGEADQLATQFQALSGRLDQVRSQELEKLRGEAAEVNRLLVQVADLNRQIVAAGGSGNNAPDLLDARDRILDELSQYVQINTVANGDGSIRVFGGDALLVDRAMFESIDVASDPYGLVNVEVVGGEQLKVTSGRFAAHLDLMNTAVPRIRGRLDDLAQALVEQVNTLHRSGATLAGVPAGDFFDPTKVTAATISLAAGVRLSSDAIAAGSGSGPGDGSVALGIAALRDARISGLGNSTMAEYYATIVSDVGQDVRAAEGFLTAQDVLVSNIDTQRQSESGVSLDEEMVNLILNQQAFAAAARLVTVADEMIQEVLRMV